TVTAPLLRASTDLLTLTFDAPTDLSIAPGGMPTPLCRVSGPAGGAAPSVWVRGFPLTPDNPPVLLEETEYYVTLELNQPLPLSRSDRTLEFRSTDSALFGRVLRRSRHPVWSGPVRFHCYVGGVALYVFVVRRRAVV